MGAHRRVASIVIALQLRLSGVATAPPNPERTQDKEPRLTRPVLPPDERRNTQFPNIRVTGSERLHIEAQAASVGKSLTDYGRSMLLGQPIIIYQSTTEICPRLLADLSRLANNVNQIAKRANASGRVREQAEHVLDAIADLVKRLLPEGSE